MNYRFPLPGAAILAAGVIGLTFLGDPDVISAEEKATPAIVQKKDEKKGDRKLEFQLVWGTAEPSAIANLKPLDVPTTKKLGMFKWKHYYVVTNVTATVALNREPAKEVDEKTIPKIRLSDKCEIQVRDVGSPRIEVIVWGKGKKIKKITDKVTKQDSLTIAGDAENDCGWFILIKEID